MFFFIAFIAAFGYALQMTLMADFYRRMDTLSAVAYRGLSLGLTMAPLLAWAPLDQYARLVSMWPVLLLLFILTACGDWAIADVVRFLPVGVGTAMANSLIAIVTAFLGFIFFNEAMQTGQVVMMTLIILAVFVLGLTRSTGTLPPQYSLRRGVISAGLTGLLLGGGFSTMGSLSRCFHPFLVGYVWELGTGLMAVLILFLRSKLNHPGLARLQPKEFGRLALACSPTLIGTGLYALSMSMGPMGLATAIIATQMVFTTLLAWMVYHEKLTWLQWLILLAICGLVMGLKIVSG
ncbi:MAG TPA: DMT family transporter [bacterium]|nr:DMT family transporter [bacterium]HPN34641.1 DMT family transporter [bacterium]